MHEKDVAKLCNLQEKQENAAKNLFFIVKRLDKMMTECYSKAKRWRKKLCNIFGINKGKTGE